MSQDASEIFEAAAGSALADPNALERLNALADEALALEALAKSMAADLEVTTKALNALKTKALPELMTELGLELIVRDGMQIAINDFVSGSLPKEEAARQKAIEWLEANEAGGLIKTNLALKFGREDREEAVRIWNLLKAEGQSVEAEVGVHAATLQAFARERLKNGDPVDTEVLGLYTGRVAKIAEAKSAKGKKK